MISDVTVWIVSPTSSVRSIVSTACSTFFISSR